MRGVAVLVRPVISTLAIVSLLLASPAPGQAENHKHHVGIGIGYQNLISDDLKDPITGIDFTNAGIGALSYRLSILPNLDLAFDAHRTFSTETVEGIDFSLHNTFFGPGVRLVSPNEGVRPFAQANLYFVEEQIDAEEQGLNVSASETGVGFGLSGGVDFRASDLISIPIEAHFMYAKPADDVSGFGIGGGITFNFGMLTR